MMSLIRRWVDRQVPIRRVVSATVASALLSLGLAGISAHPAAAAGGGCGPHTHDLYIDVAACIGDNGVTVGGDAYISRITGINCRVTIRVFGEDGSYREGNWTGCRTGRFGPVQRPMTGHRDYWTIVYVTTSLGSWQAISPRAWVV